ncbi:MAG: chemotaxis protein CheW [Candidatus Lambdaproteobacteria bacterium]|nr:chemotaxis protein CheW [Candidatus Lambdaproteobacteria bacterium]
MASPQNLAANAANPAARDQHRQFVTFQLGGEFLGIDIARAQEILPAQAITPVPLAASHIVGLISLRGQIIAVVNLRRRLGLPAAADEGGGHHIVVRAESSIASLLVDSVSDIVDVPAGKFLPPPETVSRVNARYLDGVCQLERRILAVLDVDAVIDAG